MRLRRLLLTVVLAALLSAFVGECRQVTVEILARGSAEQMQYFSDHLAAFESANPGIKVSLNLVSGGEYPQKIATMYASGVLPDVVWVGPAQDFSRFALAGMFLDLEPLARADNYDLGQFYPFLTRAIGRVNGTLYALFGAVHPGTAGLYYNKDVMDQTGLEAPNDKWTYEYMAQVARKLTQADGSGNITRFGVTAPLERVGTYLGVMQSYGGGIIADDGRTVLLNSPATAQALELMRALSIDDHSAPRRAELKDNDERQFLSGKAAMFIGGYWQQLNNHKADLGFSWSAAPIPVGPAGRLSGQANADGWAIARNTKNAKEAWTVLKWLVNEENLLRMLETGLNTVSRPRINVMPKFMQNPIHRFFVQVLANEEFRFAPIPHNFLYNDMIGVFNREVRVPLWSGTSSVRQAVEKAMPLLEAVLAQESAGL